MRYRLRTLMIAMAVFSIWLGLRVNAAKRQSKAVREIAEQPLSHVVYDFEYQIHPDFAYVIPRRSDLASWVPSFILDRTGLDLFHDVKRVEIDCRRQTPDDSSVRTRLEAQLAALPGLRELNILVDREDSEACLQAASRAKNLVFLRCQNATDAGVAHVTRLKRLKVVEFESSKLTDESLRILGTMPQLECLYLQANRFTDDGLVHLRNLKRLRQLWIDYSSTPYTDAGLKHLESLTQLQGLGLNNTLITPEGISRLKLRVPSLNNAPISPPSP